MSHPQTLVFIALTSISFFSQAEEALPELNTDFRFDDEAIQWTPHSITLLTKEELESTYRRDLEDIESLVPGLIVDRMNTTPRGAAIALRGLDSAHPSKGFDPAVALSVDGVYIGTHTGRMLTLFDTERIETARGPQGTYIGAPNLSGSINLVRTKPSGKLDLDLRASFGDYDRRELDTVLNFPVTEDLSGKLAIYWKDRGGDYMKNLLNDRNENTEDFYSVSASALWEFRDWFTLHYTFDVETSDETAPALLNISSPADLLCSSDANQQCRASVAVPQFSKLHLTAQNFTNDAEFEGDYHTLRVDFDRAGLDFTSITAVRKSDEKWNLDLDASPSDFYHVNQVQEYDQFSQDMRVRGKYSEKLDFAFGFYFLNTEYEIFQSEYEILKQLGDAGLSEGHAEGEIQELSSKQKSNLRSIFGEITYVINDQWIADLGVRWTEVERDFEHSPSRIRLGDELSPLRTFLIGEETTKETLISGGLSYKVDEEAMIYMRYGQGFLPGGFDENAMSEYSGNSYGPETVRSAEIGLKSDWNEDRLRINIVYYQMEIDDKVERFDAYAPDGDIESVLDNIAEIEVSGWELELESTPLERLFLRVAFSHTNADYTKYSVPDLTNPGAQIDNSGFSPGRAPSENLYFSAKYSLNYGPGTLHTYAGYRLFSDYQTNPQIASAEVKNWTSWDLSFTYEWQEWMFRVFSKNVKNKQYIQNMHNISQTDILPVSAGNSTVSGLATYTEYNQPRYTGFEVVYRPFK